MKADLNLLCDYLQQTNWMFNLSQETKAVLLFSSVYRLGATSLLRNCKWFKWHWTHHDVPRLSSAQSTSAACGLTAATLVLERGVSLPREAACPSTVAWFPGVAAGPGPGKAVLEALASSLHNGHCGTCLRHGMGREVITRSAAPQKPCHKLMSSNSAPPAFVLTYAPKRSWTEPTLEGHVATFSQRVTGSLRNNGINWGEVGAFSFWRY